jgi:hypothetical protein
MPKIHDWIQQCFEEVYSMYPIEHSQLFDAFFQSTFRVIDQDKTKTNSVKKIQRELYSITPSDFLSYSSNTGYTHEANSITFEMKEQLVQEFVDHVRSFLKGFS